MQYFEETTVLVYDPFNAEINQSATVIFEINQLATIISAETQKCRERENFNINFSRKYRRNYFFGWYSRFVSLCNKKSCSQTSNVLVWIYFMPNKWENCRRNLKLLSITTVSCQAFIWCDSHHARESKSPYENRLSKLK